MANKTIPTKEGGGDSELLYLVKNISNRIAKIDARVIAIERERKKYRRVREVKEQEKEEGTLQKIKTAIKEEQFNLYTWIKDKVIYIAITLLVVWLSHKIP